MSGVYVAKAKCRVCGYEVVSIFPKECDGENMECSNCSNFTLDATEYYPPEDKKVKRMIEEIFET